MFVFTSEASDFFPFNFFSFSKDVVNSSKIGRKLGKSPKMEEMEEVLHSKIEW